MKVQTQPYALPRPGMFSASEWRDLRLLRSRYVRHRDVFSARELAHLRFIRFLYQCGRIEP